MGHIQTETPYFQSNPDVSVPFPVNANFQDPDLTKGSKLDKKALGVRIFNSKDVYIYGAGCYSFFENYDQKCVAENNCQSNMITIDKSSKVQLLGLSTKAAINMVTVAGNSAALDRDNRNNFCAAIAFFEVQGDGSGGAGPQSSTPGTPPSSSETPTPTVQPPQSSTKPYTPPGTPQPSVGTQPGVGTQQPSVKPTTPTTLNPPATPTSQKPTSTTLNTPATTAPFIPGVVPGETPGVVPGFTPGVVPGFTPGVN